MYTEINKRGSIFWAIANSAKIKILPQVCGFTLNEVNCIYRYQYYKVPKDGQPGSVSDSFHRKAYKGVVIYKVHFLGKS